MIRFEKVSRLKDEDFNLPARKTENSAGYDLEAAEDIVIPPYTELFRFLSENIAQIAMLEEENQIKERIDKLDLHDLDNLSDEEFIRRFNM